MNFDFKITSWERVTVSKENEEMVSDAIKKGLIKSSDDVFNFINDNNNNTNVNMIDLDIPNEQMSVEENNGSSTIEILDDSLTVWTNADF